MGGPTPTIGKTTLSGVDPPNLSVDVPVQPISSVTPGSAGTAMSDTPWPNASWVKTARSGATTSPLDGRHQSETD